MKSSRLIQSIVVFITSLAFGVPGCKALDPIVWQEIAPDLTLAEVEVTNMVAFSAKVVMVRSSLSSFRVGVLRASDIGLPVAPVKTMVQRTKAAVGINANFFDPEKRPIGLVISRGTLRSPIHYGGGLLDGVFVSSTKNIKLLKRSEASKVSALDAVQGGPILILDGKPVSGIQQKARERRSGVCIDHAGRLILFSTSAAVIGLNFEQLQKILMEVDCKDALNLDGGGSAQLYLSTATLSSPTIKDDKAQREVSIEGSDAIPVALALFPLLAG